MQAQKLKTWSNTLHAAMKPAMARVMIGKVIRRFTDRQGRLSKDENLAWLRANAQDLEKFLEKFEPSLRQDTQAFLSYIKKHSADVLRSIPHDLGGGAGVPLLYALVRALKPRVVVETGVAAGFSSASILAAMEHNEEGRLFSSDFPYFRLENPEQYVGVVVEESFKHRWSLMLKGDEVNLPLIVRSIPSKIGLFHYDSDKSYDGRDFAMNVLRPYLADDAVIIMDDIQDNAYFHDYVTQNPEKPWSVFLYEGKYIGVYGAVPWV